MGNCVWDDYTVEGALKFKLKSLKGIHLKQINIVRVLIESVTKIKYLTVILFICRIFKI